MMGPEVRLLVCLQVSAALRLMLAGTAARQGLAPCHAKPEGAGEEMCTDVRPVIAL